MRILAVSLLLVTLVACTSSPIKPTTEKPALYTLQNIKNDFSKMRAAGIDMEVKHTWSFLITGFTEKTMASVANNLSDSGFTPIALFSDPSEDFYRLTLQTEKIYTPELLYKDTQTVENLVNQYKLRSFESLDIIK